MNEEVYENIMMKQLLDNMENIKSPVATFKTKSVVYKRTKRQKWRSQESRRGMDGTLRR